ncbi:cell division protein ZapA [Rhodovarius lipocyclicus]|uniref:cell division protein ZapA n=1 Tax=Rhodovarius lipocyclicus TaxID=268410 RepID=UPI00135CD218|nr:cell division protein ZapA [Rhodovarius lipocyclicus]
MGQVSVRVNGYTHTIGCKDGEEQHVRDLVASIDAKVGLIRQMGGQFSESRMLLHVALLLADELGDMRIEMARRENGEPPPVPAPTADPRLAERLARIAERIEGIATSLERP